jgi:hypothetical protein
MIGMGKGREMETGIGAWTYQVIPGWGVLPEGVSFGGTHGGPPRTRLGVFTLARRNWDFGIWPRWRAAEDNRWPVSRGPLDILLPCFKVPSDWAADDGGAWPIRHCR